MVNKNMIPTLWYMLEGPPSRAVLLTIRNLRLDVKLKLCRTYLKEHLDPKFVSKNPLHTVPFLDDNGFHLTDSHAITQYLVETKAPASTLIGHTPQEKALLNDRLYFDNLLFHKTRAIIAPVLRGYAQDIPEDKAKDLHETLEVLDMYVENGKWVANDHYTIADFHALPIVTNIQTGNNVLEEIISKSNKYSIVCKTDDDIFLLYLTCWYVIEKMAPIILYHFKYSPVSRGVFLTARNLGIDIEIKEVNTMAKEQLQPWYLKINPQHTVPCIDDNGHILNESRAISQYLANSRAPGSSMYPNDAKKRSIIDQRLFFDAGTIYTRMAAILKGIMRGETEISDEQIESIYEVMKWVNDILTDSQWMAGDDLTIADTTILGTLSTYIEMGVKLDDYPEIQRWYEQCKELPGFEENEEGAKGVGAMVKSKVTKGF
uniref:glutathione transferase n=1 Tax=Culicoides sonorensis TaxID=179676 RepID=A0A336LPT1_CULSO